jgi:hemerythrin
MERYRCPAHAQNKQAHERFLALIQQFKERCRTEGFRLDVLRSLHQTLSSWIQEHILQVDTQLRPCIKG